MLIKAGTKVKVKVVMKRIFVATIVNDYDTKANYPCNLILDDGCLLGIGNYFVRGESFSCNKTLVRKIKVIS